jgi:hypothetical protein
VKNVPGQWPADQIIDIASPHSEQIMQLLKKYWKERPLVVIMLTAVLLRLVASVFARGFGMHDDHFIIIEPAHSWAIGQDYDNWLPWSEENKGPSGHSFFYIGFMYLVFRLLELLSVHSPQTQMFIIRLLHGAFSLITVYYGYRMALKLSDEKTARLTGILLAAYWFMPWLSVRNLIEVVCIPFMVLGTWYLISDSPGWKWKALMAGSMFGLAFAVRYQLLVYIGGVWLVLLVEKRWKENVLFVLGLILSIALTQGLIDFLIWKTPFAELRQYILYNIHHRYDYIVGPWYNYLVFLLVFLIPPVSIFLFTGLFRNWKKQMILFLPVLLFLIFHSVFPNKQERFIIPMVPFLIMAGVTGWQALTAQTGFWLRHRRLLAGCWMFFWVINLILLPVITTMYSKKARVESMSYLSRYPGIDFVLFDDTYRHEILIPPSYYYGEKLNVYSISGNHPYDSLKIQLEVYGKAKYPRFVLLFQDKEIDKRVEKIRNLLPNIEYETRIDPGLVDRILFWLNPVNANQTIIIYRNRDFFPDKIND